MCKVFLIVNHTLPSKWVTASVLIILFQSSEYYCVRRCPESQVLIKKREILVCETKLPDFSVGKLWKPSFKSWPRKNFSFTYKNNLSFQGGGQFFSLPLSLAPFLSIFSSLLLPFSGRGTISSLSIFSLLSPFFYASLPYAQSSFLPLSLSLSLSLSRILLL